MAVSEIAICNLALAMIGADSIRSFDEDNKRARMCKNFYDHTRDQVLFLADWAFARGYSTIRRIDAETMNIELPLGVTAYAKPSDCLCPRDIGTIGSREWWRVQGKYIWLRLSLDEVGLYYTAKVFNVVEFSLPFIDAVALGLAVRLAMPIAQDPAKADSLYKQFLMNIGQNIADDMNQGAEYKFPDDIPDLDTFVNTDTPAIGLAPWRHFID
jgi:hypothetical protein